MSDVVKDYAIRALKRRVTTIDAEVSSLHQERDRLLDTIEELEDENHYVQVVFMGATNGQRYTYIDPSGKLEVGDLVLAGYADAPARVVALGKGEGYSGPYKDLKHKLTKTILRAEPDASWTFQRES